MKQISISAVPNQTVTFTVEDYTYEMTLRSLNAGAFMVYDLSIDSVEVLRGFRFVPGQFLIPYRYLEKAGNFVLGTDDDAEADYTEFGSTQFLYYYTADEVSEYRGES